MTRKTDAELRTDLIEVLDSIPAISASDIDVQVEAGMVTINGHVDTYQTRFQVERVARRVSGMRGLQINIRPSETVSKRAHHSAHGSFS